ncbi:hypothetical protein O2W18_21080 [Modestobacter sp. VKM Ac-2983]|uniref:hypothetical protein n=1 Tax=Modestobacter sp. VKM Ac-2983 TaxID=3004137 RepID=UPI0022AB753C|nr:hypothetical protein [Modestobacter sp. VKM Ac-2983]MCZ2807607.1 hypothetical protein [Modestobacter sp. VKM Ac-2983]
MVDVPSSVIPAAAALAGVVLTQAWNTWHSRAQRRNEALHKLWNERRLSLHRFIVALNQALDSTRAAILGSRGSSKRAKLEDDSREEKWAHAYELYIELEIIFPQAAARRVWDHLQDAYEWRRKAIAAVDHHGAPRHHQLIDDLRPWLTFPEQDRLPSRSGSRSVPEPPQKAIETVFKRVDERNAQ